MPLYTTAAYTCLVAALAVGLAVNVIRLRGRSKVSLGTGDDPTLERAIRAHANLVEHAPLALALVALLELHGGSTWLVHGGALSLVLGRFIHAWALLGEHGTARVLGMALTFTAFGVLIVANGLFVIGSI